MKQLHNGPAHLEDIFGEEKYAEPVPNEGAHERHTDEAHDTPPKLVLESQQVAVVSQRPHSTMPRVCRDVCRPVAFGNGDK